MNVTGGNLSLVNKSINPNTLKSKNLETTLNLNTTDSELNFALGNKQKQAKAMAELPAQTALGEVEIEYIAAGLGAKKQEMNESLVMQGSDELLDQEKQLGPLSHMDNPTESSFHYMNSDSPAGDV